MSSKLRSMRRNIAHEVMRQQGIQHPNKRLGGRNISRKYRHKKLKEHSTRSFFARNWRKALPIIRKKRRKGATR